ncbi:MAG: DUF2178 domain-containing protein [Patescibacteria group bacterium]|nr:DUF2178 domain-containing protein [Patescibacteria group bacterium]
MNLKTFTTIKLVAVIIIAAACSLTVSINNYLIALIAVILGSLFVLLMRNRVKEIMADERDYEIGGKAARYAMQIYSWIAVVAMFLLLWQKNLNPSYEPIAYTLAYSTCLLLITYSLMFKYFSKYSLDKKKTLYSVIAVIIFLVILIGGVRLFSGEDDWICSQGQWVKHGNPSFPAPSTECHK